MIVTRPSASGLGRALACPNSAWADLTPDEGPGEAAQRGTRIHAALERHILGAREWDTKACVLPDEEPDVELAVEHLPTFRPLFADWPMVEVEVWIDPLAREARFGVKAQCHHFNPLPPPPGFYRGMADVLGMDDEGRPWVLDHKTGNPRNQSTPEKTAQLYFFAAWLATHPRSAPLVAEKGVRLSLYLTQLAGQPAAASLPSFVAEPAQIEAFVAEWQDLELLYRRVEAGEAPPMCTERGDRFCRVVGCKQAKPLPPKRRKSA